MRRTFHILYEPRDGDGGFLFGNIGDHSATPRYLTCKGSPILPICGEIHFSRCERTDWKRELLKMKECGLTAVSTYVFWNHHEAEKGKFRWDGNRDIAYFLSLCRETGFRVILRIGPWCHGEARFGGFPDWLAPLIGKRTDFPPYLKYVERYWRALYGQVGDFCDGKTVLGLQLENEYGGSMDHIRTLRGIAERLGFKAPYFTVTAWPGHGADKGFLPMFGGYPEAPWAQHVRPLKPAGRFAIREERGPSGKAFPYAGCEVGTGNQVTWHRRPIISEKDGYGVAFAKFASGMNLMGYYMFHGGRNPRGELLQESRSTFYPNDCPVVDYDFQAPISKDGLCRRHADLLRLLHLFIRTWDPGLPRWQTFFPEEEGFPTCSVRCGEDGGGCLFVGNYERGRKSSSISFRAELDGEDGAGLPELKIAAGEMAFIPFGFRIRDRLFDYVTAQPVARVENPERTDLYFMCMESQPMLVSLDGVCRHCVGPELDAGGDVRLHFMERERALRFHLVDGRPVFCGGTLWRDGDVLCALLSDGESVEYAGRTQVCKAPAPEGMVSLERIEKVRLPYDRYLFSRGTRGYYRLCVKTGLLCEFDDAAVELGFRGLNLQVFCGGVLVDDCFNTDGFYTLHLRHFRDLLEISGGEVFIKTAARGAVPVYSEIEIKPGQETLTLERVRPLRLQKIPL